MRIQTTPEGETAPVIGSATALVRIGSPPAGCPQGWPMTHGIITQGPQGGTSHGTINALGYVGGFEALDIAQPFGTPVYSTFDGRVSGFRRTPGSPDYDPNNQVIQLAPNNCPGLHMVEYVHLSSIQVTMNQQVTFGLPIGNVGYPQPGADHLHYQFNGQGDRSFPIAAPYVPLPAGFDRACNTIPDCNVSW